MPELYGKASADLKTFEAVLRQIMKKYNLNKEDVALCCEARPTGFVTRVLAYRLTPEEKTKLERIAGEIRVPAGQIAGILVREYIAAKKRDGDQLFFPPKYHALESIKLNRSLDRNNQPVTIQGLTPIEPKA